MGSGGHGLLELGAATTGCAESVGGGRPTQTMRPSSAWREAAHGRQTTENSRWKLASLSTSLGLAGTGQNLHPARVLADLVAQEQEHARAELSM